MLHSTRVSCANKRMGTLLTEDKVYPVGNGTLPAMPRMRAKVAMPMAPHVRHVSMCYTTPHAPFYATNLYTCILVSYQLYPSTFCLYTCIPVYQLYTYLLSVYLYT